MLHVAATSPRILLSDVLCCSPGVSSCHARLQGFSTGLPERLQLALLRTLPGLESCTLLRPAYAVEYDYLPAHQCHASLETKKFRGLFFSGQLNGTTGGCAVDD
jgi:tRNA U34 5-carboxymethylaminomethyl modifying enzyme MnmG/GidA